VKPGYWTVLVSVVDVGSRSEGEFATAGAAVATAATGEDEDEDEDAGVGLLVICGGGCVGDVNVMIEPEGDDKSDKAAAPISGARPRSARSLCLLYCLFGGGCGGRGDCSFGGVGGRRVIEECCCGCGGCG